MARRPANRTDKPWLALIVALAVAVGLLIVLDRRGDEPTEQRAASSDEIVDGYAYTAMLMSRHPLWQSLLDLEQAVAELGAEEWEPALPPVEDRFEDIAFIESFILPDQELRMASLHSSWQASYPSLLPSTTGLGKDLLARIDWESEQGRQMVERRMARARSAESRRLAELRAQLVEQYQERLTNLSIQAELQRDEAAEAAEEERDAVWRIIETEVEATREACDRQLAELHARLAQEAADRVAEARERALIVRSEREATMQAAGAELRGELAGALQEPWPQPGRDEMSVSAEMAADPANARLDAIDASRESAEIARSEKIEEQRGRMLAALARMRSRIRTGTEVAAKVVAYRNGIRLQTIPGGRRRGSDVTGLVDSELKDFWMVTAD